MLASGSTTNRIDRLEATGLIRRADDPDDRRGVLVELTPLGLRRVEAAVERHLAVERELIAALTEAQQDQLAGLLRRLLVAVDDARPGEEDAESTPARRGRRSAEARSRPR